MIYKHISKLALAAALGAAIAGYGGVAAAQGNPNKAVVMTAWWVVFNNPEDCEFPTQDADGNDIGMCGLDDIIAVGDGSAGGDPRICIFQATGTATANWTGNLAAYLPRTEPEGFDVTSMDTPANELDCTPDELGLDELPLGGLLDPETAEVHFVARLHDDAPKKTDVTFDRRTAREDLVDMLTTVNGGCPSDCVDVQFAIHLPEGTDESLFSGGVADNEGHSQTDVYWTTEDQLLDAGYKSSDAETFAGRTVPRAWSVLQRSEEGLNMYLRTNLKASDSRAAHKDEQVQVQVQAPVITNPSRWSTGIFGGGGSFWTGGRF